MSAHANNVSSAVSGTPGTGTITLGSAVSGSQSFSAAYGANATVDVFITDGTAWEVARNCAYTHSGTTLTRGTLEASSTGSAISLTSAAVVRVAASADSGRRWDAASLEQFTVTGTSGAIAAEVNQLYVADMSGWTADRTLTLPAVAAVGDRVGVMVSVGDDAYEWLLTAASGDTLNAVAGGTEWSRLFITGEVVIMRCVAANATWVVEKDGRIPSIGRANNTSATSLAHATFTKIGLTTSAISVGGVVDTANSRIFARRAGNYSAAGFLAVAGMAANSRLIPRMYKNGANFQEFVRAGVPLVGTGVGSGAGEVVLAAGDYVELYGRWDVSGGSGSLSTEVSDAASYSFLSIVEVL